MRIDIITVIPELIEGFLHESILGRAQKKGLVEIHLHNLRDYAVRKDRRIDDYPFGGFAGMVMQCEPIDRCISALTAERHYDQIIFTTPDGEQFSQPMANELSLCENIIILCGHYKGIDFRIREHLITKEVSIGDYVLTGGELAADLHYERDLARGEEFLCNDRRDKRKRYKQICFYIVLEYHGAKRPCKYRHTTDNDRDPRKIHAPSRADARQYEGREQKDDARERHPLARKKVTYFFQHYIFSSLTNVS